MILNSIKPLLRVFTIFLAALALYSTSAKASIKQGNWNISCRDGLSKTLNLSETGQSQTSERFHQDRTCQHLSFEFITSGRIEFSPIEENQIDFTYSQIQLVVHIEEVIRDFNERAVCGLTNWKRSEAQTITGLKCALFNINKPTPIPKAEDKKYGIYKIESDKLFFGRLSKEFDGSSPEKRPQEYDLIPYLFTFF